IADCPHPHSRCAQKVDRCVLCGCNVDQCSPTDRDVSMFGLSSSSPDWIVASSGATVHWTRIGQHASSRSKVGAILRQPCGSSSSAARVTFPPMHFAFCARMLRLGTDQCIIQTLVVALVTVMRHEFRSRFPHRPLAEQDHPLQTGFLDRTYKPF